MCSKIYLAEFLLIFWRKHCSQQVSPFLSTPSLSTLHSSILLLLSSLFNSPLSLFMLSFSSFYLHSSILLLLSPRLHSFPSLFTLPYSSFSFHSSVSSPSLFTMSLLSLLLISHTSRFIPPLFFVLLLLYYIRLLSFFTNFLLIFHIKNVQRLHNDYELLRMHLTLHFAGLVSGPDA